MTGADHIRKVRDISRVDRSLLKNIGWPAGVVKLGFTPERQVTDIYAVVNRNIPPEHDVRLSYFGRRKDLRVPPPVPSVKHIKGESYKDKSVMLADYRRTLISGLLKIFYPRRAWPADIADGLEYFRKASSCKGLRAVKNGRTRGMVILSEETHSGEPVSGISWIWIDRTLTADERRHIRHLLFAWVKKTACDKIGAGVDGFNRSSQLRMEKAGLSLRYLWVIKKRISFVRPPGRVPEDEWEAVQKRTWRAIMAADYQKAMDVLEPVYKRFPRDPAVARSYGSLLGDYAEFTRSGELSALKRRSLRILAKVIRENRDARWDWKISALNEYYYHAGRFKDQYELGVRSANGGAPWGDYSRGVGASNYAYALALKGRPQAAVWAGKAIEAWKKFFAYKPDYYNAWVHYALALGLSGRADEAKAALRESGRLAGKPASYYEFAEVRRKLAALQKQAGPTGGEER